MVQRYPSLERKFIFFAILLALVGCATVTGPSVTREEIEAARSILQVKALGYQLDQVKRINGIGYRIVRHIPQEDIKVKPRPFLGLFCLPRNKMTELFFKAKPEKGIFVAFVLKDTPAGKAGLKRGDILLGINKKGIKTLQHLVSRTQRLKSGQTAVLTIVRQGKIMDLSAEVEELPVDVRFSVEDHQSVNASVTPRRVHVTYGLLNFTKSDDEVASVIGHELGHLARGHVGRAQGGRLISKIAALGLGVTAEIFSPGSGRIVSQGVGGIGNMFRAKFSRNLEREADYFSVKYIYYAGYDPEVAATVHERLAVQVPQSMISGYLSTHPSSPERSVRIRKAIEELRQEENNP